MPKSKEMCSGCHGDCYNHNREGGCWNYKTAKIITVVFVGTWQNPPYLWQPQKTLSCWHCPGRHPIRRDDPRVVKDAKEAEKWRRERDREAEEFQKRHEAQQAQLAES